MQARHVMSALPVAWVVATLALWGCDALISISPDAGKPSAADAGALDGGSSEVDAGPVDPFVPDASVDGGGAQDAGTTDAGSTGNRDAGPADSGNTGNADGGGWPYPRSFNPAAESLVNSLEWSFTGTQSEPGTSAVAGFGDWSNATAASPVSAPDVGRTSYPAGSFGDGAGGATWAYPRDDSLQARKIAFRMMVFFSSNYSFHSHFAGEKFFYPVVRGVASGNVVVANPLNLAMTTDPQTAQEAQSLPLRFFFTPQTQGSPDNYPQVGPPYVTRGQWHQVEVFFRMNNPGQADGIARGWIDGQLAFQKTDVVFADVDAFWLGFRWTGTRGGGSSQFPVPPGGQYRDYDHVEMFWSDQR